MNKAVRVDACEHFDCKDTKANVLNDAQRGQRRAVHRVALLGKKNQVANDNGEIEVHVQDERELNEW